MSWIVLSAGWAFYLYEYLLRVAPSVMTENLMADFGVMAAALGVLTSMYYLAYVPLQIPCGVIVDYWGPRKVVTISALLCMIGSILFAYSENLYMAQLGRLLIGAGSACAYISCMKIASTWFNPSMFSLIAGSSQMMGTIGGTLGNGPLALVVNTFGWRQAMFMAGLIGGGIALISWLIIRDRPKDVQHVKLPSNHPLFEDLKIIAFHPQNILIGIYGCLTYLTLSAFAELWGVPFLMQMYGVSNEIGSYGTTAVFLGFALGSALSAALSEKIKSRVKVMSWSAILTSLGFSMVFFVPGIPLYGMYGLLFLTGIFSGGQILYFTMAVENSPRHAAATTIGFTNAFVMVSGLIFQPLLGKLIESFWDGQLKADGLPLYSMDAYRYALSSILIASILAWIVTLYMKETYEDNK
jgi:MFS family permease